MRAHNWALSRGRRFSPLLPCLYCRPWPALDVTSQTVVIARPFKRGDPAYETRLGKRGFWVESLRAGKVGGPISRCVHVGVAAGVGVGGLYVCSCSGARERVYVCVRVLCSSKCLRTGYACFEQRCVFSLESFERQLDILCSWVRSAAPLPLPLPLLNPLPLPLPLLYPLPLPLP